ncbi:MAG TPA: DUF3883 domain-containing protein [Fimbriimonadaceae bacterium]|nr:DUF3883 domain-containing protein [Fimbriimonadaceae bacterium]
MTVSRIDLKSLILGYAMSRLDRGYLVAVGARTWDQAYDMAASKLGTPRNSFKLLRDEFDVYFPNERKGWRNREMHPSRIRLISEFEGVSEPALIELVQRILARDKAAAEPVLDILEAPSKAVANVADRLLTGRQAEEFFMENCEVIIGLPRKEILDSRLAAQGYDFGLKSRPEIAIEVKGMRAAKGQLLFTDREWTVANIRREDYWLVVVGDLEREPRPNLLKDPATKLPAACSYQTSITASWRTSFALA